MEINRNCRINFLSNHANKKAEIVEYIKDEEIIKKKYFAEMNYFQFIIMHKCEQNIDGGIYEIYHCLYKNFENKINFFK